MGWGVVVIIRCNANSVLLNLPTGTEFYNINLTTLMCLIAGFKLYHYFLGELVGWGGGRNNQTSG